MKFFGGELFALFTPMFSYILQKDDPESKIILQNRGTKHGQPPVWILITKKNVKSAKLKFYRRTKHGLWNLSNSEG